MPCILKVRVIKARNVTFPDRVDLQALNSFVEIKFGSFSSADDHELFRTSAAKRLDQLTRNEDFRFEIADEVELQTIPLSLKLYDNSSLIAGIEIDLNPLLCSSHTIINGFFPLSDTVDGVLGELHIQAKLLYFGEANAPPIKFFASLHEPESYKITEIIGLVDIMLLEKDPEYHWTDSFRATRSSNEARTSAIRKLMGELKDTIGKKVTEMGGNAVVGYSHSFEFETFSKTIVARATGTAVKLTEIDEEDSSAHANILPVLPATMELFTLKSLPASFNALLKGIGGVVSSRAIKLLSGHEDKMEREQWLFEIREGIKSNAKLMKCTDVIGYSESISVSNDLLVISAVGTAIHLDVSLVKGTMLIGEESFDKENYVTVMPKWKRCFPFHIPYRRKKFCPFEGMMDFTRCNECKKRHVPQILFSTLESPYFYQGAGEESFFQPYLIDAYVCRGKKTKEGENNASSVSDAIPFIESDLHRQLLYKMRLKGFNALFDFTIRLSVGEKFIVAVATGTGYFLHALPRPTPLKIFRSLQVKDDEDRELIQIQEKLMKISTSNRDTIDEIVERQNESTVFNASSSDTSTSSEDDEEAIEIDDDTDEDLMSILMDPELPSNFVIVSSNPPNDGSAPTKSLGNFFSFSNQASINPFSIHTNKHVATLFKELIRKISQFFNATNSPLFISNFTFGISFKADNVIVVDVYGLAFTSLQIPSKPLVTTGNMQDLSAANSNSGIFSMINIRETNTIPSVDQENAQNFDGRSDFSRAILVESLNSMKACCLPFSTDTIASLTLQYARHEAEPNYLLVILSADFCKSSSPTSTQSQS